MTNALSPFRASKFDNDPALFQSRSWESDRWPGFGIILIFTPVISGAFPSCTEIPNSLSEQNVAIFRHALAREPGLPPNWKDFPLMVRTAVPGEAGPAPLMPDPELGQRPRYISVPFVSSNVKTMVYGVP